jgi:hypothetical protein
MTTTLTTPSSSVRTGAPSTRRGVVVKAGATAALIGAVAAEAVAGIARAVDVPMRAGGFGAGHAEAITVGAFATATVLNLIVGTLLAAAIARWARRPESTFVRTALPLTLVSFAPVLLAGHTATATKVTLATAHVVVAAIAIPLLARAVAVRTRS